MEIENTTTTNSAKDINDNISVSKPRKEEDKEEKDGDWEMEIGQEGTGSIIGDDDDSDSKPSGLSVDSLIALKDGSDGPEEDNGDNDGRNEDGHSEILTPVQSKKKRGRPRNDRKGPKYGKEMKDELKILRKLSEAKNENLEDYKQNDEEDCFANLNKDIGFTPEFKIVRKIRTRDRFSNPKSRGKSTREFLTPRLKKSRSENNSYSRIRSGGKRGRRGRPGTGHSGYKRQKRALNGRFVKGKKNEFGLIVQDFDEYYPMRDEDEDRYKEGLRFKRYNDLASSLKYLKYMNWDNLDPRTHKTSPFHGPPLTVMSFWFLVCCQYFPKFDPAFFDYILTKTKKILDKKNLKVDFMFKKQFKKKIKKSLFIENLKKSADERLKQEAKDLDYSEIEALAKELAAKIGFEGEEEVNKEISNNINYKKKYSIDQDISLNKITRYLEKRYGNLLENKSESRLKNLCVLKKLPLDCMINSLGEDLKVQEEQRNKDLEILRSSVKEATREESYFEGTYDPSHALKDLFPRFNEELEFLDRLEENQHNSYGENKNVASKVQNQKNNNIQCSGLGIRPSTSCGHEHKKSDDYDCQICSDGDYSEDNLIVFCARCNVSVHQKCYGLEEIPEGNWICDLCKAFGPKGQYLPCPFCTKRGGAMRKTHIYSFDDYWKNLNSEYYEQMKLSEGESYLSRPANPYHEDQSAIENDDNLSINSKNFTEFLYYNFHKIPANYSLEELVNQPKPLKTWVHLSCCHWIPEIYFGKDDVEDMEEEDCNSDDEDKQSIVSEAKTKINQIEIKGIEEIDKRRYNLKCEICDKKQGAAVQCAQRKCQLSYHVECARRANIFIEPPDSENPCYIIYCEKHAPLMIKRELEAKRKTTIQEITKFCRTVEKYYQSYKYKFDPVDSNDKSFFYLKDDKRRSKIYERQNNADYAHPLYKDLIKDKFMREVEYELNKFPEFGNIISIKKNLVKKKDGTIKREYEFIDYEPPRKRFLYNKIPKNHKVWSRMAKSRGWQVKGVYKKYRRVLAGSKEDAMFGLEKKKIKFKKPKYKFKYKTTPVPYREVRDGVLFVENKESKGEKLTVCEGISDELFCECKRPWKGEIMIGNLIHLKRVECSECTNWFHPECLGVVEKDEVKLNQMVITCSKCKMSKNEQQSTLEEAFLGKRINSFEQEGEEEGENLFKIPVSSPIKKLKLTTVDVGEDKMMVIEDRESTQDQREGSSQQILGTLQQGGASVAKQEILSLPSNKENLVINLNRVTSREDISVDSNPNEVKQTNLKEFFVPKKPIPSNTETKNSAKSSLEKTPTSTSV